MKIALLTDGIYPQVLGGIQKHSYYLSKYLAQESIHVHILHPCEEEIPLNRFYSNNERTYISQKRVTKPKARHYPGHYIRESYSLSKLMFDAIDDWAQFDFIYAQGFTGWYYGKMRQKNSSLPPLITNFHGLEMFQKAASFEERLKQCLFKWPVKRVSQLSDLNCSLGGKLTPILERLVPKEKIIETPIGISEDWLIDSSDIVHNPVRKFVFLGRYERRKGIEELSESLRELIKLYNFEFHFIGPISKDQQIQSEKVYYHGLIKDSDKIKQILQNSDILVCPSHSEGMPTVILEAMASACAIIASDVGAVCEQVDNTNGILLEPGKSEDLRSAITHFIELEEEKLYEIKKQSLMKIREKFLWSKLIDQNLKQFTQYV